jgi:hypothetical protein
MPWEETCFCAVLHRQDEIVKPIIGFNERNSITNAQNKSGSTILHMAAMLEPSTTRDRIAGEALKMQSELFWFKVVSLILLFFFLLLHFSVGCFKLFYIKGN